MPDVEQCDSGYEPIHEAGARGIQIERGTAATQLVVDPRRSCGQGLIGGRRREHEKVDLASPAPSALEGTPGGLYREP